jgi:hypothetical protein
MRRIAAIMHGFQSICLASLLGASIALSAETLQVIYPAPEFPNDVRYQDIIELLTGALDHTAGDFGPYRAGPTNEVMNETRYLNELATNPSNSPGKINVAWSSTSEEKEKRFHAIRISLRKDLLGYRIALIAKANQAKIDKVHDIESLRRLTVGQGLGWGDIAVYKANGIDVITANYANLFPMTAAGRFDMFPRGINEVFDEYKLNRPAQPDLAIEQNLILYYPWPYYLFVYRDASALANRLETGLRRMIADGTFDQIFLKYHGKSIKRAEFERRRIIRLQNPLLPPDTPLNDRSLSLDPEKF